MRDALKQALYRLAEGPLRERAEALFGVLGYHSDRVVDIGGVAGFVEFLDADGGGLTGRERALFDGWIAAEIVFQITGDEIVERDPRGFDGAAFDRGRFRSFLFVAAELGGAAYTRTQVADMVRAVNRHLAMPVVLLLRRGETASLAVVHRRARRREAGREVLEKVSIIKDMRLKSPHRAQLDALADLSLPRLRAKRGVHDFETLHAEWERAFDVESLNRRFFRDLFAWFQRAVRECSFPDDGAGDGSDKRHVIRMITRLLFVWFLAEKGLVPSELFDREFARKVLARYNPDTTDYYRAVLQNLFFATLNTEIDARAFSRKRRPAYRDFRLYRYRDKLADPESFLADLRSVPFVNGGLFDCLDSYEGKSEGGRRIDAFTDNERQGRDLRVPARLFFDEQYGLFPLFRRYKFTVEEHTPLDKEVALDPELLGRVFENLLAAYNPETRDTARRATGSYYTPRSIVNYIVDTALVTALADKVRPNDGDNAFWRERLRYLLDWEDAFDDARELFKAEEVESLVAAIATLRVLDPAVGSGAFPMGILHKLTLALRRLDPDNARWERLQTEIARGKASAAFDEREKAVRANRLHDINETFETYRDSDYGRKLYLIQNGIFGVDVQPVACQIAKLRFFISLIIEQEPGEDPADNYGVRPLPNLETRFVAANTLIGIGRDKQGVLRSADLEKVENDLRNVRESYFNARERSEKLRLRRRDAELRGELARTLEKHGFGRDSAEAVSCWDLYDQNACATWFDPEWMFNLSTGFDLVIGNPPYVRGDKVQEKARLRAEFGEFYNGSADIYTYFFRRGVDLLCSGGLLCFITSNKFMRAMYGRPLRVFLEQFAPPRLLLDLGRTGAFDATVRPSILLVQKDGLGGIVRAATVRRGSVISDPAGYMETEGFSMPVGHLSKDGWSLAEPALHRLRQKIEAAGKPLKDHLDDRVYYGVKTGFNAAFVIDEGVRAKLIDEDAESATLIRPWLRGKDIRRWRADWGGLYVIFARQGVDLEGYPAIERYLSGFRADLEPKIRQGERRGRAPGAYKWYEFQANIAYHGVFSEPKIVYADIGTEMRAFVDRDGYIIDATAFMLPCDDGWLAAILNSTVLDFYFRLAAPCLDDPFDGGDMRFKRYFMETVPIAAASSSVRVRLSELAFEIQERRLHSNVYTSGIASAIDDIVYALYRFDRNDVALTRAVLQGKPAQR